MRTAHGNRSSYLIVCLSMFLAAWAVAGLGTSVARADDGEVTHEFRYKPDAASTAKSVNLAGEFNAWSTTATPMTKGDDGVFKASVKLKPGKHLYKFVLDGTTWINDPEADKSLEEDDGQKGQNSAVMVAATDAPANGEIEHVFTFKPTDDSKPKSMNLAGEFNNWSTDATPMTAGADGSFTAKVKLKPGTYHYKFVIEGTRWTPDPAADKSLDQEDGHGGMNSGVVIK